MRAILEAAEEGMVAPTRVLLLPAAYAAPEDFVREGFVRAARERRLPVDLVFVELKLQHLTDRTILRRLRHETSFRPGRWGVAPSGWVASLWAASLPWRMRPALRRRSMGCASLLRILAIRS